MNERATQAMTDLSILLKWARYYSLIIKLDVYLLLLWKDFFTFKGRLCGTIGIGDNEAERLLSIEYLYFKWNIKRCLGLCFCILHTILFRSCGFLLVIHSDAFKIFLCSSRWLYIFHLDNIDWLFCYHFQISRAIREIRQYQQLRYSLEFDKDVSNSLIHVIAASKDSWNL